MRAVLLSLLFIAIPAMADDAEYYPVKIGTQWTFKIGEQADRFVWTAVKTEKVGTQECIVFEGKLKDQVVGSEHVAILKNGIFRFKLGENVIDPPVCFFKSNAKGESWKQDFKLGETSTSAKYTASIEDVEVPAGKYKDAILIQTEASDKDAQVKASIWFVKNVGMVKQSFEFGNVKYSLVLEKMEEPKK